MCCLWIQSKKNWIQNCDGLSMWSNVQDDNSEMFRYLKRDTKKKKKMTRKCKILFSGKWSHWFLFKRVCRLSCLSSVMSVMSVMSVNVTWWISSVRCLLLPPPDSDTNTAVGTERMEGSQRRERSWPSPRPSPPHPPTPLQPSSSFHFIFFHLRNKENVSVEPVIIIC